MAQTGATPSSVTVLTASDPNDNTLTIVEPAPSALGRPHSSGRFVQFVRDAGGRITQVLDESGRSVGYTYDAQPTLSYARVGS